MIWADRFRAAILAVLVTAAAGAAVLRYSPEKPLFSPRELEGGLVFTATGVRADETVAVLDGNEASAEMYAYFLMNECAQRDLDGPPLYRDEAWDIVLENGLTVREDVTARALDDLRYWLAAENFCARWGVVPTAADELRLAAYREEYRADMTERCGGEERYRWEMYAEGLSEACAERLGLENYLLMRAREQSCTPGSELYADDDVLRAYAEGAGWITADHILLATVDLNTRKKLDAETVEQKRQLAEDLLWQLRDSSDPEALFDELAGQYGEDPGRLTNPKGYTFTHGTMAQAFDDAAHALAEGEYSDVVETEYGFHIILRRHLDVEKAVAEVRGEYFQLLFDIEQERAELETTPALEQIDAQTLYAARTEARQRLAGGSARQYGG